MSKQRNIIVLFFILFHALAFAQEYDTSVTNKDNKYNRKVEYPIKLQIIDKETNKPIKSAYVSVNGILYPYNYVREYYPIRARLGDQLVVYHSTFETIYHKITTNEDIKVEIDDFDSTKDVGRVKTGYFFKDNSVTSQYFVNLDSANFYKKIDIEKSLSFIESILKKNHSKGRNAATYRLLADIYVEWKQYDLAIANYKNSLQFREDESTKLELAKAAIMIKEYDEAEVYLQDINTNKLGLFQKILIYESLGDIYLTKKSFEKATSNYQKALKIAEDNDITSKVTDLNSELGDVLVAQGKITQANKQFDNSIKLAQRENSVRSLEEKNKVADYFNQTQQFDKEIDLRKQTLLETQKLNDSVLLISDDKKSRKKKEKPQITYGSISENLNKGWIANLEDSVSVNGNSNNVFKYSDGNSYDIGREIEFLPPLPNQDQNKNVTTQSINYKIGRALVEREDYKEAIPFLKKSIEDADSESDLVVKKDATRKLSEVYSNVGEYDKAFKTYREYVDLVDTLYVRKEQEIEQAKRFQKRIAENQNRIASLEKDKELNASKVNLALKDQQLSEAKNESQQFIIYSLMLGIIIMVIFAVLLFRSNKQQKLTNNLLALKSMRSQMNPHFIFNALNSVNSFIAVNDERNANRYLSEFSVLMRSVLENSDEDFIPFSKEIELLELYVKLEHNRFKEKFDYQINVDNSIDLDEFSIPPMLLQPYIENAIWHGLRYKEERGILEINIKQVDKETLSVSIEDNGVGRKRSQELKTKNQLKQKSKGMSTIKKRVSILNNMYQDRISVSVSNLFEDETGTKVELLLKKN